MKARRKPKKVKNNNSLLTILLTSSAVLSAVLITIALRPTPSQSAVTPPPTINKDEEMVLIPAPTRAIALGEKLANVTFIKIKWPKSRLVGQYIADTEQYREAVAISPLPQYLPIPTSALSTSPIAANAVVERIPDGMRAITVTVDAEAAVEGWARSNNYVDVILIRSSRETETGLEAKVIAENVKILSADRSTSPVDSSGIAPKAPNTITLLTSQEDGLKIKTASNLGKLAFALRGKGDESPATVLAMNQKEVLGSAKAVPQVEEYQGYARDSAGALYVLGDKSRNWIKSSSIPRGISSSMLNSNAGEKNSSIAPDVLNQNSHKAVTEAVSGIVNESTSTQ